MTERKYPTDAPLPRTEDSEPVEPGVPMTPEKDLILTIKLLVALIAAIVGYAFGLYGAIFVSGLLLIGLNIISHLIRSAADNEEGRILFWGLAAVAGLTILLPVWLGYLYAFLLGT